MFNNHNHHHHRSSRDEEETSTVQLHRDTCTTTSLLGQYLLEGEWTFLLDHLSTPDGHRDVWEANDPLGLFRGRAKHGKVPSNDDDDLTHSAFYAAIHVRAPFAVAEAIYECERQIPQTNAAKAVVPNRNAAFLACVLAVIPSEEADQERRRRHRTAAAGRMQTWSLEDRDAILKMILRDDGESPSAASAYLAPSPKWVIPSSSPTSLTPLGMAAYNPDVSAEILKKIYDKAPEAASREGTLFGRRTLPWIAAAASPLPPKGESASTRYRERQSEDRWEKVRFLVAHWNGSDGARAESDVGSASTLASTVPTMEQILRASEEAIRRGEWELVREFLKRYYYGNGHCGNSEEGAETTIVAKAEPMETAATKTSNEVDDDIPVVMAQPWTQQQAEEREINMSFSTKLPEPSAPSLSSLSLQPASAAVATTTATAGPAAILEPIHRLLVQHDRKLQEYYRRSNRNYHSKEEWMRKHMGLVMFPVDAMVDLASAVVPSSWVRKIKNKHGGSGGRQEMEEELERALVAPMS